MTIFRAFAALLSLVLFAAVLSAGQTNQPAPAGTPQAASQQAAKQSFCPPCEMKLDPKPSLYVDVEGYRIYVCSSYCGEKIKKNPSVYIKKIQEAGETPEALPGKQAAKKGDSSGPCAAKSGCCGSAAASGSAKK
jgi:YHS domain-containing protein